MNGYIDNKPKAVIELNDEELYVLNILLGSDFQYGNKNTERQQVQNKLNELVARLYSTMMKMS